VLAVTDVLYVVMCGTCRGLTNAYGVLVGKLAARDHWEDGRKILGCVLKKYDRSVWTGLRPVAAFVNKVMTLVVQ